jgi:hypothetical protein
MDHEAPQGQAAPDAGKPLFFDLSSAPQLSVENLKELARDPENARRIAAFQQKVYDELERMAGVLAKDLANYQTKQAASPRNAAINVAQLAALARRGEAELKTRQELARDLLVASVINYGNLEWDPSDPATSWSAERNPSTLLSLLLLGPVDPDRT